MTTTLEQLTNEVRKLTRTEFNQFRDWILEYRPVTSNRADWSDHAARVREIFGPDESTRENAVLLLRAEERF